MPVVDKVAGTVTPRRIGEPLQMGVSSARLEFGPGVSNPANSIRELVEAIGALPWDAREQDFVEFVQQMDPRISQGEFLAAALWPLARYLQPAKAAGIVHLNYNQVVTSPTPLFAASDLEFFDGAGRRYVGSGDLAPPATIHDTSGQTGTASETISSGTARIAQRVDSLLDTDFPQAIRFGSLAIVSGSPVATFRIETDSAGLPSGILADERLQVVGQTLLAGTNDVVFEEGAILTTADYWLVAIISGGTVTFDGGVGGTANQVKVYTSSWADSDTVENLNVVLYNGGKFNVTAAELGIAGNIEADAIAAVRANGAAQTLFDTIVESYGNLQNFRGGRDPETPEELRARVRLAAALRGTPSEGGIVFGLTDGSVDGVTFADISENDTMDWGQEEIILDNSEYTGDQSESIDGFALDAIAQQFDIDEYSSISAIAVKLAVNSSAEMTLRIETDNSGSPSGTLATPKLIKTLAVPAGTNRTVFVLDSGDFPSEGTYWLVAIPTNGAFNFDGQAGGGLVKVYDGASWPASASVGNINVEILGGTPPKSFHLFVDGGSDNDVAQGIHGLKSPGVTSYGHASGIALDSANRERVLRFSRPINVDAVFSVEVEVTPAFAGTADTLRDLISEYVESLGIGDELVFERAQGGVIAGDSRTIGVHDIVLFRQGKKADFPTPDDLTSAEVVNLSLTQFGSRFRIANPATDIKVVLVPVAG